MLFYKFKVFPKILCLLAWCGYSFSSLDPQKLHEFDAKASYIPFSQSLVVSVPENCDYTAYGQLLVISNNCTLSLRLPISQLMGYYEHYMQQRHEKFMFFSLRLQSRFIATQQSLHHNPYSDPPLTTHHTHARLHIESYHFTLNSSSLDFEEREVVAALPPIAEDRPNEFLGFDITTELETDTGMVLLKDMRVAYVSQPPKYPLQVQRWVMSPNTTPRDDSDSSNNSSGCELLGHPDAVILHTLHLPHMIPYSDQILTEDSITLVPRVLCGVFSTAASIDKITALTATWLSKCASYLIFSTSTNHTLHAMLLPHMGVESYNNMWQKSRSIWKYLAAHYLEDYDYFLLGGDDMFYVMENLYDYLLHDPVLREAKAKGLGVYLGREFFFPNEQKPENSHAYNTGGPGYLLDTVALERLMTMFDNAECGPLDYTSLEDIMLAHCLQTLDPPILPPSTADSDNRQRWHFYPAGFMINPTMQSEDAGILAYLRTSNPHQRYGLDCCSTHSVSFHALTLDKVYSYYAFLYSCPHSERQAYFALHGENHYDSGYAQNLQTASRIHQADMDRK